MDIDWSRVEAILLSHYTVGTRGEGADAWPPLLLFKCLLLQNGVQRFFLLALSTCFFEMRLLWGHFQDKSWKIDPIFGEK